MKNCVDFYNLLCYHGKVIKRKGYRNMKFDFNKTKSLYNAMLSLENIDECKDFFEDIFTVKELQDISQRFEVAIMLDKGKSYNEISECTGASTATISRVNRCLVYGNGGYKTIISRMKHLEDK